MSRLIDAEHFKRFLQALCKAGAPYDEVIQLLDKEPTVCDVEKVVAELEENTIYNNKFLAFASKCGVGFVSKNRALEILRKYGVDV